MRLPLSRRSRRGLYVLVGLLIGSVAFALAFGPLVRSRVAAEAAKRHLEVRVGAVRPGWFCVHLLDVDVRPQAMVAVQVRLDDVRVRFSGGLHVEGIEAHGGEVTLTGDAKAIQDQWAAWRGEAATGSDAPTRGSPLPISGDSISLRWTEEGQPHARLQGVGFSRDDQGLRLAVGNSQLQAEGGSLELVDASLELDARGALVRAHAGALVLQWTQSASAPPPAAPEPVASASAPPPVVAVRATAPRPRAAPATAPEKTPDASTPFVRIPDLHLLRGRVAALAARLAQHVPVGAVTTVDAMTWKIEPAPDERRVALTIGPGPFSFARTATSLELRFSTDTRAASTALSARVLLPTDAGDVSATLEGGPVALSLLGIHEGAAGLVDVDKATVTGTARLTLAGDGGAVTFDAELGTRGLSIHEPRLALDVVRGIDLDVRARGALSDAGDVRLDDVAATLGAIHVAGSATLEQKPDHVAATVRFELPSTACQSLLDSIPTALLPAVTGTRMSGAFGARGRFAFDTRSIDDLELDYDIQDQCRIVAVPMTLARERFKQPFAHRIYLPDASTAEQTTGPGTPNWTPLAQVSPYMQVAVLTTEDGGFPHHRGFNRSAIRASIVTNLKARRFVRGASTITMQLAKNLFLSRDKTLARKLEEVVLTDYLEQTFSKDEIMELYLNVIEFGPAVYGITSAAEHYFGRAPSELNLAESLFLSSLLPAPLRYGSMRELAQAPEGWVRTLRYLMRMANKRGLVTDAELAEGEDEAVTFWHGGQRPAPRPPQRLRSRLDGNGEDDPNAPPVPDMPLDSP